MRFDLALTVNLFSPALTQKAGFFNARSLAINRLMR